MNQEEILRIGEEVESALQTVEDIRKKYTPTFYEIHAFAETVSKYRTMLGMRKNAYFPRRGSYTDRWGIDPRNDEDYIYIDIEKVVFCWTEVHYGGDDYYRFEFPVHYLWVDTEVWQKEEKEAYQEVIKKEELRKLEKEKEDKERKIEAEKKLYLELKGKYEGK